MFRQIVFSCGTRQHSRRGIETEPLRLGEEAGVG
jgi:hypothetical protein